MSSKPVLYPFFNAPGEGDSSDLNQALRKYLYHWKYFVVGVLLTMIAAFLYLKKAQAVYEVKATLLIQDENKNKDEKSTLQEIDLSNSPKLVENEIEVLKSRKLILSVVNDLNLWINYSQKIGMTNKDLYHKSPFKLSFQKVNDIEEPQQVEIVIKSTDKFSFKLADQDAVEYSFNTIYTNDLGSWQLIPSENLKDAEGKTIFVTLNNPQRVADIYQEAIDVIQVNKQAPAVSLVMTDQVSQRGKDVLNTLISHYNLTTIQEKNKITQNTLDFIDKRLASLSGELKSAESEVEGFRSSRGLTDISSQSQVYLENVQSNDNRLNEVNVQLNVINGIERYVNSTRTETPPSVLGISDAGLSSLIEKLSQLQLQRDRLLATTPEGNPAFGPIDRQIASTRASIRENIRNIKSSLLNAKKELQSFNSKFESSIRNIPTQERQLIGIKRQQSIKENLYVYLLQKREELSLSYAATLADARIVDNAYEGAPKKPKVPLVLSIALILGLIFPASLIYAKDNLNNRITTRKQIEEKVEKSVLNELTFEKSSDSLVVLNKSNFAIGEQFRALRTNLHFLHGQKNKGRVTLLTSSISSEGKSFVSVNLGAALAVSGRKTIILEFDLRRPNVLKSFNLDANHPGLSNYLISESGAEDIIQASGVQENLDLIGSGQIPPNPSELLEQPEIDSLIAWLRDRYDDILIDTPPVQLVTDAMILSRVADVTLYVIRQGHTHKSLLTSINNLYKEQHFPKMNIIFNGIKSGKYGYGDNYGNDYYAHEKKKSFFSKKS